MAAAFALVVALEATLFGVYAPVRDGAHESGAHVQASVGDHALDISGGTGGLIVVAALFVSLAGVAFPFFLRNLSTDLDTSPRSRKPRRSETGLFLCTALALFSTSAAVVHFAVLWEHFEESWVTGTFFAIIAPLQLGWAALVVLRPSDWVLWSGLVGNLGVVAVWLLSRTVGLPIGPERWSPEPIGAGDSLATVFEVAIVIGAATLGRWGARRLVVHPRIRALPTWTLALLLVPLTSGALLAVVGATF